MSRAPRRSGTSRRDTPTKSKLNQHTSRVKVFVRVRPFLPMEHKGHRLPQPVVTMGDTSVVVLDPNNDYFEKEGYSFERCFWSLDNSSAPPGSPVFASQADVYEQVGAELLDGAFDGYNTCLFAYGQTSSGKTYTMLGTLQSGSEKGVVPRLCEDMFQRIQVGKSARGISFRVEASYFEIYNEKAKDLLQSNSFGSELRVRQHPVTGPFIEGLSIHKVTNLDNIINLLNVGGTERTTAATHMNDRSSRSHAIFTITLTIKHEKQSAPGAARVSKINLVDLAGSERSHTALADSKHFKETTSINLSLTTLGRVIDVLGDKSHGGNLRLPPYRDSALTWLLSDSLGGNSKTFMMATISPAPSNYEETLSTLRYSSRARNIINIAHVNHIDDGAMIKELKEEVEWLRGQLTRTPDGPHSNAYITTLEKQLQDSEATVQRLAMQLTSTRGNDSEMAENNSLVSSASEMRLRELADENHRLKVQLDTEKQQNSKHAQDILALNEKLLQKLHEMSSTPTSLHSGHSGTPVHMTPGSLQAQLARETPTDLYSELLTGHPDARASPHPSLMGLRVKPPLGREKKMGDLHSDILGKNRPQTTRWRDEARTLELKLLDLNQHEKRLCDRMKARQQEVDREIQVAPAVLANPLKSMTHMTSTGTNTPISQLSEEMVHEYREKTHGKDRASPGEGGDDISQYVQNWYNSRCNYYAGTTIPQYRNENDMLLATSTPRDQSLPSRGGTPMSRTLKSPTSSRSSLGGVGLKDSPHSGGGTITPDVKPYFGIEIEIPEHQASIYTNSRDHGVRVISALGPAQDAGMKPGDIILSVGDLRIFTRDELKAVLQKFHADDLVTVNIDRNGSTYKLMLRVGKQIAAEGGNEGMVRPASAPPPTTTPMFKSPRHALRPQTVHSPTTTSSRRVSGTSTPSSLLLLPHEPQVLPPVVLPSGIIQLPSSGSEAHSQTSRAVTPTQPRSCSPTPSSALRHRKSVDAGYYSAGLHSPIHSYSILQASPPTTANQLFGHTAFYTTTN